MKSESKRKNYVLSEGGNNMKKITKIITMLLIIVLLAGITGCGSDNTDYDDLQTEINDKADSSSGNDNIDYDAPAVNQTNTDYSNFGFENMYGMNTWMEVDILDITDTQVTSLDSGEYATLTFNNGFLKQELWNRTGENKGVYYSKNNENGGYLWHTNQYAVIDNYNLQLYNYRGGATLTITNVEMYGKIPIITVKFITSYHENTSDGTYIPADFIDWSSSPEECISGTYNGGGDREGLTYYIDTKYLE